MSEPILKQDVEIVAETITLYRPKNSFSYWHITEDIARYDGSTHVVCNCGKLCPKSYTACAECSKKARQERYQNAEAQPWNGYVLYSESADKYFDTLEEAFEWVSVGVEIRKEDFSLLAQNLELYQCEPEYLPSVNPWEDLELPRGYSVEDIIPDDVREKLDELNKLIENREIIISFLPTNVKPIFS